MSQEFANRVDADRDRAQSGAPPSTDPSTAPGKVSSSQALPAGDRLQLVAARAGQRFSDPGGFSYEVLADGSFKIIAAPAANARSVGAVISQTGRSAIVWPTLANMVLALAKPVANTDAKQQAAPQIPFEPKEDEGALLAAWHRLTNLFAGGDNVKPEGPTEEPAPPPPPAPVEDGPLAAAFHKLTALFFGSSNDNAPKQTAEASTTSQAAPATSSKTTPSAPAAAAPAPKTGGSFQPVAGDLIYCMNKDARLRDANRVEIGGLVPLNAYVRVLEVRGDLVRVAQLADAAAPTGTELGWTAVSNFKACPRAPRPSDPAQQMAALLAIAKARSGKSAGNCYHAFKANVTDCGGYGDILEIHTDERFEPYQGFGINFFDAIEHYGPAAFSLERVSGLPRDAAPGTVIVTLGNGKEEISSTKGDVAVIGGLDASGTLVNCYNDGLMQLYADPAKWESQDKDAKPGAAPLYQGVLKAMYRPIARK